MATFPPPARCTYLAGGAYACARPSSSLARLAAAPALPGVWREGFQGGEDELADPSFMERLLAFFYKKKSLNDLISEARAFASGSESKRADAADRTLMLLAIYAYVFDRYARSNPAKRSSTAYHKVINNALRGDSTAEYRRMEAYYYRRVRGAEACLDRDEAYRCSACYPTALLVAQYNRAAELAELAEFLPIIRRPVEGSIAKHNEFVAAAAFQAQVLDPVTGKPRPSGPPCPAPDLALKA
jgi:hypothetical protein